MKIVFSSCRFSWLGVCSAGLLLTLQSCCMTCLLPAETSSRFPVENDYPAPPVENTATADLPATISDPVKANAVSLSPNDMISDTEDYSLLQISGFDQEAHPVFVVKDVSNLQSELLPTISRDMVSSSSHAYVKYKQKEKLPLGIQKIESFLIAGPNISFKRSNESEDVYGGAKHRHKPGLGFQFGAGANLEINEKFSVSTGLLFKQNNASEEIKGNDYSSTDKYRYSYLSVPVLASFKVGSSFDLLVGPELNYLLSSGISYSGEKRSLTDESVKLGLGVQGGVKYRKDHNSRLGVQLMYDHRISRLNKSHGDYYYGGGWYMSSVQLSLSFSLCDNNNR